LAELAWATQEGGEEAWTAELVRARMEDLIFSELIQGLEFEFKWNFNSEGLANFC
jgi:hypothetical protein